MVINDEDIWDSAHHGDIMRIQRKWPEAVLSPNVSMGISEEHAFTPDLGFAKALPHGRGTLLLTFLFLEDLPRRRHENLRPGPDAMPVTEQNTSRRIFRWSAAGLALGIVALWSSGALDVFATGDRKQIRVWIDAAGAWGPVLIVLLMTVAIVATPIPSAPVALAAGAAYGHTTGTALVVAGAEIGALAAFLIARGLGRSALQKWLGHKIDAGLLGSQNTLTLVVFGSRLLPFISFDMISYAAGLSAIHFWRFALATLAGIVPASFLLAHIGSEAMNGDAATAGWTAALLGLFTLVSVSVAAVFRNRPPNGKGNSS